jgi:hypothetical protein
MAVNLSPVFGVAGQLFNDNGDPLAGGKIYTYAAGTTTPAATYTNASGSIAHSNPIVLDGAGRVPTGEIWLTDGISYKFVVEDAASNLIGTYDNLTGINSNFVNFSNQQEIQTATAGQTVFTLTTTQYQPGTNSLTVFVDGVNQYGPGAQYAYVETDSTTVTFTNGLHVGAEVKFTTSQLNSSGSTTAGLVGFTGFKGQSGNVQNLANNDGSDWIGFLQDGTNAVARSAQDKMRDFVSVLDFGADPTGLTDSSAAFIAARDTGKSIFVPKGTYQASFGLLNSQIIYGEGARNTSVLIPPAGASFVIALPSSVSSRQHCQIRDLSIQNPNNVASCVGISFAGTDVTSINDNHNVYNVYINGFQIGIYATGRLILCTFENVEVDSCVTGMRIDGDPSNYAVNLNTFIMCRWISSEQEGVRITGYNIANKFISCNVEANNTDQVAGVAGMYVEDAEGLFLDNPYFELNGSLVAVDGVNPLNNSIGLRIGGERCFNLRVTNGWMVQSGTLIAVNVSQGIIGGEISGIRFAPNGGGFDIYIGDKLNGVNAPPLIVDSNNYFSGKLSIKTDGAGQTSGAVRQTAACQFVPGATTLDLRSANKFVVFTASGFNLINITNRFPGMTMMIVNNGAAAVTIDASLMFTSVASTIAPGAAKQYLVLGFSSIGKFSEI